MCIRDRVRVTVLGLADDAICDVKHHGGVDQAVYVYGQADYCLLYTSDAADERSRVDLGGRRVIKKKNTSTPTTGNIITRIRVITSLKDRTYK